MTLQQYIFENIEDIKNSILANIESCNDEKTLKRIKRILAPTNPENLNDWFIEKGLGSVQETIIDTIDKNAETEEFFKIVTGEQKLPTLDNFIKDNNIYKLLYNIGLSEECLKGLNKSNLNINGTAVGAYEILCTMFLNQASRNKGGSKAKDGKVEEKLCGDFRIDNMSIEIKADGAAAKGYSVEKASKIDDAFENYLRELQKKGYKFDLSRISKSIPQGGKNSSYFESQGSIISTLNMLAECGFSTDAVNDILANCLMAQFNSNGEISSLKSFLNNHKGAFFPESIRYTKKQTKKGAEGKKYNFNDYNFSSLFGIIDIYFYHKASKWDYLVIFDKDNGNYKIIDGKNCNDFEKIYKYVQDRTLIFDGIPSGDGRSAVTKIRYSK